MFPPSKWFWRVYFLLFSTHVAGKVLLLFYPESPKLLYFRVCCWINSVFCFDYFAAFLQTTLSLLGLLVIGFSITDQYPLPPVFWRYVFWLRVVFDITGHAYERNIFLSLWRDLPWLGALYLLSFVIFFAPSYWINLRYAWPPKRPTDDGLVRPGRR